jgi:hypothetical protein
MTLFSQDVQKHIDDIPMGPQTQGKAGDVCIKGHTTNASTDRPHVIPDARKMRYYDLPRHWTKKIAPHLKDEELNRVLVRDFNKFTWGRWREKWPRYWDYVKHAACHWLVNFALRLAMLVEPKKTWRIITSDKHSTVWDGKNTLFDFNFLAFGISAEECFELAYDKMLRPGEYLKVFYAAHYSNHNG